MKTEQVILLIIRAIYKFIYFLIYHKIPLADIQELVGVIAILTLMMVAYKKYHGTRVVW